MSNKFNDAKTVNSCGDIVTGTIVMYVAVGVAAVECIVGKVAGKKVELILNNKSIGFVDVKDVIAL